MKEFFDSHFVYDKRGFLVWRKNKRRAKAGAVASERHKAASCYYKRVTVCGKHYREHRVIWLMHGGIIPDGHVIDHINGDSEDNRIENLRCVTNCENKRNSKKYSNNTSGFTGVLKRGKKFSATIGVHGKLVYIGTYSCIDDAVAARKQAEKKYGFERMARQ